MVQYHTILVWNSNFVVYRTLGKKDNETIAYPFKQGLRTRPTFSDNGNKNSKQNDLRIDQI